MHDVGVHVMGSTRMGVRSVCVYLDVHSVGAPGEDVLKIGVSPDVFVKELTYHAQYRKKYQFFLTLCH